MQSNFIFDASGRKLGFLELRPNRKVFGYDAGGKFIGYYCQVSNVTYNASGRRIGIGDMLSNLICAKGH
jgi:hypothetical protein